MEHSLDSKVFVLNDLPLGVVNSVGELLIKSSNILNSATFFSIVAFSRIAELLLKNSNVFSKMFSLTVA